MPLQGDIKNTIDENHKLPLNVHYFAIGLAIVMFWRGMRWLMDMYFFPGYPLLSHVLCVVLALCLFLWNNGKLDELGKL